VNFGSGGAGGYAETTVLSSGWGYEVRSVGEGEVGQGRQIMATDLSIVIRRIHDLIDVLCIASILLWLRIAKTVPMIPTEKSIPMMRQHTSVCLRYASASLSIYLEGSARPIAPAWAPRNPAPNGATRLRAAPKH
jgi:hypothetical protein